MNVYENALEKYNSGLFLQLEGSYGRYFVNTFIKSGIIKMINEQGNTIIDGYNKPIILRKACIDYDKINELWDDNPEFMEELEGEE